MTAPWHAITVRQPWTAAIVAGVKRVENRSWRAAPGWYALHAAARIDPQLDIDTAEDMLRPGFGGWTDGPTHEDDPRLVLGAIVAAILVGVALPLREVPRPTWWHSGPLCWPILDVRPLRRPIPYSGALGLWIVRDEAAQRALGRAVPAKDRHRR